MAKNAMETEGAVMEEGKPKKRRGWLALLVIIIIVVLAFVAYSQLKNSAVTTITPTAPTAKASEYQAVFLVNGQVYFGKLSNSNSQYPVLRDIYYLQINQQIQPAQKDKNGNPAQTPSTSLIKLGGELHGPTDEMQINRDQILIIEDLREDSRVVTAIREYQKAQQPAK